ncbi:MAG: DUF5131 family protein [Eubacterium sp.]
MPTDIKWTEANWNPWHGCTRISDGCKHCYVYRQDEAHGNDNSSMCKKNLDFYKPVKKKRGVSYKIPPHSIVYTCFTSDFLLEDADEWRNECWQMMRERSDCYFYFFTKRIDRLAQCLPDDWGDGYDNVLVGCTVENQQMADYRLPIFRSLAIKHKSIIIAPILGKIDISQYLDDTIEEVSVGGESGNEARACNYDWILDLRNQCVEANVPFRFHQTGARFIKDGKEYRILRRYQHSQAHRADINYRIGKDGVPETAAIYKEERLLNNENSNH